MPKDTKSSGNNKAPACESRGFGHKKEGENFDTPSAFLWRRLSIPYYKIYNGYELKITNLNFIIYDEQTLLLLSCPICGTDFFSLRANSTLVGREWVLFNRECGTSEMVPGSGECFRA